MAALQKIPLGGTYEDLNSAQSRQGVINLLGESTEDGSYKAIKDGPGLTLFSTLTSGAGRSNLFVNSGFMYAIAGTDLIRANEFGTVTVLGSVGGSGRGQIFSNSVPGDNQIMVLNGIGDGYVYTDALGVVQVTDPDFLATVAGTVQSERGYFARRDTNEFFASDISDFTAYNPLSFASAESNPDVVQTVIAKKSAVWVLGSESIEYFQSITDTTFPLRAVIGASKDRGISAVNSLADAGERFCWFADDNTVRMIEGSQMTKISDLAFELIVRGDGTTDFPGFSVTDDAIGFFVDGPVHKIYYLTFPTEQFTWGYDFTTGLTHLRTSETPGFWRVGAATLFNNKLYGLDIVDGFIYELDQSNKTENGVIMRRVLTTPTISAPHDWTLPYVELDIEIGQGTDPTLDPQMSVEYTKDGGYNYTTWGNISLGKYGDNRARVPMRLFGRIKRYADFALRFTFTDDVRVQMYSLWADIEPDG